MTRQNQTRYLSRAAGVPLVFTPARQSKMGNLYAPEEKKKNLYREHQDARFIVSKYAPGRVTLSNRTTQHNEVRNMTKSDAQIVLEALEYYESWCAGTELWGKALQALPAAQRLVEGESDRDKQGGFVIGDVVEYIGQYRNDDGWRGETFIVCEIKQKAWGIEYTVREHDRQDGCVDGLLQSDLRRALTKPPTRKE